MKKSDKINLPKTYSETIYQYVKKSILSGELRAKEKIREKDIANKFKVSITPVREAIRRLSGEKFLIINAHRDIIVAGTSWKECQEIYEVIGFLDFHAIVKAIDVVNEKDLDELKKMTKKMKDFLTMEKADLYLKHSMKIHNKIWNLSDNKFLLQILEQLMEKISFFNRQGFSPYPELESMKRSYEDHENLIIGIEKKDIEMIQNVVSRHWYMPY
ncbi:MAG TPA: GntR family transcriptional regulator [Acidobacteriota bacterium]|nr:GntR family transcriptional regulator [Acidobacteriota bacterium]